MIPSQREKFAYARGARIQFYTAILGWVNTGPTFSWNGTTKYRVHPEDEHLSYGPVAKAIREIALTGDQTQSQTFALTFAEEWCGGATWGHFATADWADNMMYCFFLAEMLADEGL